MSDETPRRSRRGRPKPVGEGSDPLTVATTAALASPAGSPAAIRQAQEAVFHLLTKLSPALPGMLDLPPDPEPVQQRNAWLKAVQFLHGSGAVPVFRSLSLALVELDRGITASALMGKPGGRRGGLADTEEMQLMSYAVEAADELKRRCRFDAEYRAELKESETSYSTIETYRARLASAADELKPRNSYILAWGAEAPEIVLQRIIWALSDTRNERRRREAS